MCAFKSTSVEAFLADRQGNLLLGKLLHARVVPTAIGRESDQRYGSSDRGCIGKRRRHIRAVVTA